MYGESVPRFYQNGPEQFYLPLLERDTFYGISSPRARPQNFRRWPEKLLAVKPPQSATHQVDRGIGTAEEEALASRVAWWPGNTNEMGIPKYSVRGGSGQQGISYITPLFS